MALLETVTVESLPGNVTLLRLAGDHDLHSAGRVRAELASALAAGSALVVDLRVVTFLDSAVAGALLEARKQAKRQQLGLTLLLSPAPGNHVRRMFEQIGLSSIFSLHESERAAVDAALAGTNQP